MSFQLRESKIEIVYNVGSCNAMLIVYQKKHGQW